MVSGEPIEQCIAICDAMIQQLQAQRPKSARHDRQSPRQIDFAIRTVQRLADRFKAFRTVGSDEQSGPNDGDKLTKAIDLLRELRPIVAATRPSTWRQEILQRIDDLVQPRAR